MQRGQIFWVEKLLEEAKKTNTEICYSLTLKILRYKSCWGSFFQASALLQWSWSLTTTSITASLWLGRCITSLRHLLPFRICLGILAVIFLKHIKKTKKVFISLFKNHSKTKLVSDIMFENPFKKYNFDYFWRKIWNVSKIENHVIFLHENFNDFFWADILRLCIGRLRRH